MSTATMTQSPAFILTPPDVLTPVVSTQIKGITTAIPADRKVKIDQQLDGFLSSLVDADVQSDDFRTRLDQAFSLGRKEIADATSLTNSFTSKNFVGETNTPAYKAISEMRTLFDELNPAKQGDLFSVTKVLGIPIPFGNKLANYLRRYESASTQITTLYDHIVQAKDEVQKGVTEMGLVRQRIWDGITNLESVEYFIATLDEKLTLQIDGLKQTDPVRAKALETEVLYYVRQNVGDVLATKALSINAYNVAGELRKTGREVINGCDRTATLGMAALTVAVTLARATGVQVKTMEMINSSKKSIEDLIAGTGDALISHAKSTTEFASNPILGVEALQGMFTKTFEAMDIMDNYRTQSLASMNTNNDMLRGQLKQQMSRITSERRVTEVAEGISL